MERINPDMDGAHVWIDLMNRRCPRDVTIDDNNDVSFGEQSPRLETQMQWMSGREIHVCGKRVLNHR